MDSLLVPLQAVDLCGLMIALVTAVAHLLMDTLDVLLEIALITRNEVTQMAGVADPLVDSLHVHIQIIRKVCHIGTLCAPDLWPVFLVGIVLVPSQGLGIQGLKFTGVTSDHLLLLCVQVADVPLQCAHVKIELTAHLTRIFKIQMYTLFVASQRASVRCFIVTLIARKFHSPVNSVLMPFHGPAAQEAGPA